MAQDTQDDAASAPDAARAAGAAESGAGQQEECRRPHLQPGSQATRRGHISRTANPGLARQTRSELTSNRSQNSRTKPAGACRGRTAEDRLDMAEPP